MHVRVRTCIYTRCRVQDSTLFLFIPLFICMQLYTLTSTLALIGKQWYVPLKVWFKKTGSIHSCLEVDVILNQLIFLPSSKSNARLVNAQRIWSRTQLLKDTSIGNRCIHAGWITYRRRMDCLLEQKGSAQEIAFSSAIISFRQPFLMIILWPCTLFARTNIPSRYLLLNLRLPKTVFWAIGCVLFVSCGVPIL